MNPYGGLANRWFQPLTHVSASVMRSRGALAFKDWAYSGVYRPYQLRLGPSVASMMIFYGTPMKSRDKRVFHALHVSSNGNSSQVASRSLLFHVARGYSALFFFHIGRASVRESVCEFL